MRYITYNYNDRNLINILGIDKIIEDALNIKKVLNLDYLGIDGVKIKSIELNVGKMTLLWNLLCKNYDNEHSRKEFSKNIKKLKKK